MCGSGWQFHWGPLSSSEMFESPGLHSSMGLDAQQQIMPPSQGVASGDCSVYPSPGKPPARHNPNRRAYDNPQLESEPLIAVQRSKNIPSGAEPLYTANNPSNCETPFPVDSGLHGAGQALDPQWPRESVGTVLDAYFEEPEYYDSVEGYSDPSSNHYTRTGPIEFVLRPSLSRPVVSGTHSQSNSQWNGGTMEYSHRSQSQPDLQGGYEGGASYDGMAEIPATGSTLPKKISSSSRSPSNIPAALPVGSPSPACVKSQTSSISSHSRPSVQDGSKFLVLPSSVDISTANIVLRHLNLDGTVTHPPPIRLGLLPHGAGHLAPVRQYNTERMAPHPIQAIPEQAVTVQELEHLQNVARLNPLDQKLQLTLAKKMVEAAIVLASKGGRADIKTTRKIRENYIVSAYKIIKRLTNSVRRRMLDGTVKCCCSFDNDRSRILIRMQCFIWLHVTAKVNLDYRLIMNVHSISTNQPRS